MTIKEAIDQLRSDMDMILSLEQIKIYNEDNYRTYIADEIAIKALEKQIAKKPVLIEDKMYLCPNKDCHNNLLFKYAIYPDVLNTTTGLNYCLCCGQKLDWSEEE